jgi:hypothetical protein
MVFLQVHRWQPNLPTFMAKAKQAATYKRAPESRGKNVPYEQKFAGLIKLCEKAKAEGVENVIVTWPWVIGDNYDEIIESLSRISDAGLILHIVERHDPDKIFLSKVSRN